MSAEAVNGYTLLAEPAHWSNNPQWILKWDTEVAATLRGNEGRSALREMPRPSISYGVQPMRIETQAQLSAALIAGMASGKCCAPTFGRASWLAGDVAAGAAVIHIEPSAWAWSVNDWLLIYTSDGGHQTAQITAIDTTGTAFTLAAALTADCDLATAVYPLFFGRPEITDITQTNGAVSSATITLVGDNYVISSDVPLACQSTALQAFDFAVIRYQWAAADGRDLDTRTALVDPAVEGDVGWSRQTQVPASGAPGPFLMWGGDNTTPAGAEAVLVNFAAIAAAYPAAATITIRLRANWYGERDDGQINLQFATYLGGTMQGPVNYDFVNQDGAAVQVVNSSINVTSVGAANLDGMDCGTLVYTPATKAAILLPP